MNCFVTLNYVKVKLPNSIVMKMSFGDTVLICIDYLYENGIYGDADVIRKSIDIMITIFIFSIF